MRRHHLSNGALAAIVIVAVVLMWLINRPDGRNVPDRPLFRSHHAAGSVTDNVLMSDFQGLASQSEPIMPSRALGIFRVNSERSDQGLLCLQGGKPAQSALVQELSGCAGVLAVNVTLRFQLMDAAIRAGNAGEAGYQAERLAQAYTLLRVTDAQHDRPLRGWDALQGAVQAGDLTQAGALLPQVVRDCTPCQGPDGQRFTAAAGPASSN